MSEAVTSAGLQSALASQAGAPKPTPRRAAIQLIRQTLRKGADASDDEMDDALEALVELSKD